MRGFLRAAAHRSTIAGGPPNTNRTASGANLGRVSGRSTRDSGVDSHSGGDCEWTPDSFSDLSSCRARDFHVEEFDDASFRERPRIDAVIFPPDAASAPPHHRLIPR